MKVSLSWLKELVDFNLSEKELADKLSLTSIGIKQTTDDFIELDLTYNRGDLLSLRGAAREVAAITNSRLLFSENTELDYPNLAKTSVEVTDQNLCPVYCVAKIEGIKVGPSPFNWVKKLKDSGIRSVNNAADVTNLIMLEYGQPLHAFDGTKVKDETLIVRVAKPKEQVVTLDNKTRTLDQSDLLIADLEKPLAIAGVMGGKDSEVTETTQTILLEAAIFDPVTNRNSSKSHGIYSEATKRFQHGLTKTNLLQALSAAIKMYESLGGKLTAITFAGNLEDKPKTVQLTGEKINSLIGVEISPEQVEKSLQSLGFNLEGYRTNAWEVTVPYFRLDINIEEDLIEEVARMYGYEKIPGKPLPDEKAVELDRSFYEHIYNLKAALRQAGLTEVETYSFYSSKTINDLRLTINDLVKIANPISTETQYLRDSLWPNLLEAAARNIRQGYKDIAIFEIGKVYSPQKGDLPKETYHLSIVLSNGGDNPIQELYQLAQTIHLGGGPDRTPREYFHPTRHTDGIAEIHPRFVNKFGIEQRVAVLEVEIKEPL